MATETTFPGRAQLGRIDEGLWAGRESFLAHGRLGEPHQERQPILLADQLEHVSAAAQSGKRAVQNA